jgi:hypothetical protein
MTKQTNQTSTMQMSRLTFDRMVVGKVYRFGEDGRKGRLIAKHEDGQGANAKGWGSSVPMITVRWMEDV